MPEPAADALQALRDRLEETRRQAQQLADDAAAGRSGGAQDGPAARPSDLQALVGVLELLRELVPPELQQQLAEVTRQVLLLVRALIDWWVERLEAPAERPRAATAARADPRPARDIPVT